MKKIIILTIFLIISNSIFSQVPFPHISNSTISAERVASFGVIDTNTDFLEITNSTQYDNSFIPSIWAHQQSDNRYVLRLFATTTSAYDNGDLPLMMFRSEIRNNPNPFAPNGGTFPWGTIKENVTNRPVFGWENGDTRLMTLRANGFLGIGTSDPTALLHTVGTLRFENLTATANPAFILSTDVNGNVFKYNIDNLNGSTGDADWLKTDDNVATSINDNIYTNGKVGINTNSFPNTVGTEDVSFYNLFVEGGILTEEVRVALKTDWADYVFKEGYKLPTLNEVEQNIKDKGHLINIPSASEVKNNGIELGEMNKKLLEKVEELTLYIIDLNKKLDEQQKEINALKSKGNEKK